MPRGVLALALACVVAAIPATAHAQLRRWGSYQMCNDPSCAMCYANTPQYQPRGYSDWQQYQILGVDDVTPDNMPPAPRPKSKSDVQKPPEQAPTPQEVVDAMLAVASVTPNDLVYDLGCGDGRILKTAWERWGAKGVGIEISPAQANLAMDNCRGMPITIVRGDVLTYNLHDATVVTMYLYPMTIAQLAPKLRSARVILSYCHPIPGYDNRKVKVGDHTFYIAEPRTEAVEISIDSGPTWTPFVRRR